MGLWTDKMLSVACITYNCTLAVTPEGHRSKVGRLAPLILHVGTGRKLNGQLHLPATLPQENIFQYTMNIRLSGLQALSGHYV